MIELAKSLSAIPLFAKAVRLTTKSQGEIILFQASVPY